MRGGVFVKVAGRAYLQIVESRRDGDQVRQQAIATRSGVLMSCKRTASWNGWYARGALCGQGLSRNGRTGSPGALLLARLPGMAPSRSRCCGSANPSFIVKRTSGGSCVGGCQ
jgi:hypothetical protein